jgi:hypothetical protein
MPLETVTPETNTELDDNMSEFAPSIFASPHIGDAGRKGTVSDGEGNVSEGSASSDEGSVSRFVEASAVPEKRVKNRRSKQPKPSSTARAMKSTVVQAYVNKAVDAYLNANVSNPVTVARAPKSLDEMVCGKFKFAQIVKYYDHQHPKAKNAKPPLRKNRTCKKVWVDYTKLTGPQTAETIRSIERDELLYNVSNQAFKFIMANVFAWFDAFLKANVNDVKFDDTDDFIDFFEQLGIVFSFRTGVIDKTTNNYFDPHIAVFYRATTIIWDAREQARRKLLKKAERDQCLPYWKIPVNTSWKESEPHNPHVRPFIWPCEMLTGKCFLKLTYQ